MNDRILELTSMLDFNPGASEEVLRDIESKLGVSFPAQFADFLLKSNGVEGSIGNNSYLVLWPIEEMISLNDAYAVNEFAPGLLLIGSDGGGVAYAFDTRVETMPIVAVPFVGMDLNEAVLCGRTFVEFLEYLYNQ